MLCRIRHRRPFSRYLDLLAGDGRRLGHLKRGGRRHHVTLSDGRQLQLSARWFGQGWVLVDEAGAEVLASVRTAVSGRSRAQLESGRLPAGTPSVGGYRIHHESFLEVGPDDWLVTPDGSLDLAQTVAIVEAYRTLVKAAQNHR